MKGLPRPHKARALVPSRLFVVGIKVGISGSIDVTDNDWFAFLAQQPGIDLDLTGWFF